MSSTGLKAIDTTVKTTNIWLDDIMDDLRWTDRHKAYEALRAVLHALRDRLSVDGAAHLAAQLPLLVRGIFYEGWHPSGTPVKERRQEQFVAHVAHAFARDREADPAQITRSVLKVLTKHMAMGAAGSLKKSLPEEIRELFD